MVNHNRIHDPIFDRIEAPPGSKKIASGLRVAILVYPQLSVRVELASWVIFYGADPDIYGSAPDFAPLTAI
jgi:hypothetical protein